MNSYHQFCGVARALDIVGERWTLLIVRDLLLGPRRFGELQRGLAGISSSVLTQRLHTLSDARLVERDDARSWRLTEAGRALEPTVLALGAFGAGYLDAPRADDRLDPRWAMLALKRRFAGAKKAGSAVFAVGADAWTIRWTEHTIDVRDGEEPSAAVRVAGGVEAWFGLLASRRSLDALCAAGALEVVGDAARARDVLSAVGARLGDAT